MIIFAIVVTFFVGPKLGKLAPQPGEQPSSEFIYTQRMMKTLALTNMILGIIVLFCVSIMQYN
jgi:hypothetical protein